MEPGCGKGRPGGGAAWVQRRSPAAGHDVGHAGGIEVAAAKRDGALIVVLMPPDRHLYTELLEDRIECGADVEGGAMFAPCAIRRPMKQRDLPGLFRCGE